ncbi:MAG TPA: hypothetical protein VGY58_02495, partial [Gemmataceae bacterium]|nr:hypothetical protein [Gemmataceae bacterium]
LCLVLLPLGLAGPFSSVRVQSQQATPMSAPIEKAHQAVQDHAQQIDKAQKLVQEQLAGVKDGNIQPIRADSVAEVFPKHFFFSVIFPHYPVARFPAPPFKGSNLYAVPREGGKPKLLTQTKELEAIFRDTLPPVRDANAAKPVVRAWLELAPMFLQDGYYKFGVADESIKADSHNGEVKAEGKVLVKSGGNGEVNVTMTFDKAGKLIRVKQTEKVKRGVRPICQASKLLDKDPVVRAMAEQDLMIMGRAAKPYLEEQRAIALPALRKAIDHIWQRIMDDDR